MKRSIICLIVAVLTVTLVAPADAAKWAPKKVTRNAVTNYDNPSVGAASGIGGAACLPCPSFIVSSKDRWVEMEVQDDVSPNPVGFDIRQLTPDGRCCDQVAGPFCGSTGQHPIRITPGLDVYVFVFAFGDVTCPGAFATTGSVEAVFSNIP